MTFKQFDCPYCKNETNDGLGEWDAYVHLVLQHRDELPDHWKDVLDANTVDNVLARP